MLKFCSLSMPYSKSCGMWPEILVLIWNGCPTLRFQNFVIPPSWISLHYMSIITEDFRYFMPISHGVNRKTPPSACRHLSPPIRFSPGCLLFYKKHFINFFKKHFINLITFSSHLIRLSAKDKTFSKENNFFFNWLLVGFDFAVLFMCFLRCFL